MTKAVCYTGYPWNTRFASYSKVLSKAYKVSMKGVIPKPIWVSKLSTAKKILRRLIDCEYVAVDTEHDYDEKIVVWSISDGEKRWTIAAKALPYFKKWLENPKHKKIFHHAAHDLRVFARNGIEVQGFAADTMVMDWFVDENRRKHGLKSCAMEWLDIDMVSYEDAFTVIPVGKKRGDLPDIYTIFETQRLKMVDYASLDAYATFWLFVHHKKILQRLKAKVGTLWDLYSKHDVQFTKTLSDTIQRGMAVDVKILQDIGKALDVTIADARKAFSTSAPDISVDRKRQGEVYTEIIKSEDINLNSPAQLSGLFYGELGCKSVRTKACTSTDREHLQAWADDGVELAKHILEFRSASTIRQTFIGAPGGKGLLAHVTDGDTRCKFAIYTQLNQTGTVTGRLSSRQPNLQNIPARREKDKHRMRRAFVARDGHQLIVADYSGAELRVMAHLSKDPEMLKALREGKDLHSITAKRVWNLSCEVEEVKTLHPDIRNHAKAINFGLQYGMSAGVLADQIGVTKEEAQDYIDKYFDFYSGVYRWMSAMVEKCRSKGYVTTLLGRRRRIPDINLSGDDNFGRRKHCENQAMNAPIQGGVADIIKIAMNEISLDPYMQGHEARLIMQVHDELIVECPEIDAYGVRDRVKELMEGAVKLRVPMIVDAAIGSNWEDAKA